MLKKFRTDIYKLRRKVINFFFFIPYKGFVKHDLIIFDDIFPHPISGFRLEEFTYLLGEIKKSKIVTTSKAYPFLGSSVSEHIIDIKKYVNKNKILNGKINIKSRFCNINTKLFYCIFLNNIYENLCWINKFKIPFAFTLYPGGGFKVNDNGVDEKLKKVFSSPNFKKVIVTQLFTKEYLIDKNLCPENKIEFIFGCVIPQISITKKVIKKNKIIGEKKIFNLCFCAVKYTDKGEDKGYDLFIELAHKLVLKYDFLRFHVIGGFNKDDINIDKVIDNFTFYGYKKYEELPDVFKKMDVFLSPNRPFVLNDGEFDGFPLGTVIEAALNNVLVIVTDKLQQNSVFVNGEDIIISDCNLLSFEKEIIDLIENPEKLINISNQGRQKFSQIYSNKIQMLPRSTLLNSIIKNEQN
jgi:glycosyltransferase involved in cell wall biosynthesis